MPDIPSFDDIHQAHNRIQSYVHRTPVITSRLLNQRTGAKLFLKSEHLQRVGAFKFRGATNAILQLSDDEKANGVATHSSGNHAQAIAASAKAFGIEAHIVMPANAPQVKVDAVRDYGAQIYRCKSTLAAREAKLKEVVEETGATFIHPYNHAHIIAGQGTAALELLDDQPNLDLIMAPVGGGGLISGSAIVAQQHGTRIIGAEPAAADDAYRSFQAGKLIPVEDPDTIADGLRTSLSDLTFACIQKNVDDIITVQEETIIQAMRFFWERTKQIIEPSSAVPLAAVFENPTRFADKQVGIILSGGNMDLAEASKLFSN